MPAFWQFCVTPIAMVDTLEAPDEPSPWKALDASARVKIIDQFDLGESIADCSLPTQFRLRTRRKTIPDTFMVINGWPVVSARFRTLLERFDLGICDFYPIGIVARNGTHEHGDFFILHARSLKDTLVEAKSEGDPFDHRLFGNNFNVRWSSQSPPKVTLSPAALEGPDLWREKRERRLLYASDALHRACKAEKIRTLYDGPVTIDGA